MARRATDHPNTQPPATRYRVEYHEGDTIRSLGTLPDAVPHHTTLDPFVSKLLRSGVDGDVLLIDETTDKVAVRREVRPFTSKARDHFRKVHN